MEAAENITAATDVDGMRNITATMAAKCSMVLTRVGSLEQYKQLYQRQIGYTALDTSLHGLFRNQSATTTALVDILAGKSKDPTALVASVVTPTAVGLTLLAVAVAVWAVRRGAGSLRLLGGTKPPGLGDGTTLVVTDIQVTVPPPPHGHTPSYNWRKTVRVWAWPKRLLHSSCLLPVGQLVHVQVAHSESVGSAHSTFRRELLHMLLIWQAIICLHPSLACACPNLCRTRDELPEKPVPVQGL
jgi:hypothetical protein